MIHVGGFVREHEVDCFHWTVATCMQVSSELCKFQVFAQMTPQTTKVGCLKGQRNREIASNGFGNVQQYYFDLDYWNIGVDDT
ncbi:MAG: hypothetical protein WC136_11405 [Sphaerochaeta sp.]